MKIEIDPIDVPLFEVRIGNVYPISGGWGRRAGNMMVLIAITKGTGRCVQPETCLFLTVDKDGNPLGTTQYSLHTIEERVPITYVEGLDTMSLRMRPL